MGRAAEIARAAGSRVGGAEHLFLGMLHDGGWPVRAIAGLVDLAQAEEVVRAILDSPGYSPPPPPKVFLRNDYVEAGWGWTVAAEMGDSYLGLEHALLAMIRDRETVPARALAGLADLNELDAAVVAAAHAPVVPHPDAAILPAGQQLDSPLLEAINGALPDGAIYGFNGSAETGESWIHVWNSTGSLGRDVSREVLNTALLSLGRPGLDR